MWTALQVELGGWAPVTRVTISHPQHCHKETVSSPSHILFLPCTFVIFLLFLLTSIFICLCLFLQLTLILYFHFILLHSFLCWSLFCYLVSSVFLFDFMFIPSLLFTTLIFVCYLFFLSDCLSSLLPSFPLLVIHFLSCRPVSEKYNFLCSYFSRYREYLQMANRQRPYDISQFVIFSILVWLSVC
jgi:hypothetical protein